MIPDMSIEIKRRHKKREIHAMQMARSEKCTGPATGWAWHGISLLCRQCVKEVAAAGECSAAGRYPPGHALVANETFAYQLTCKQGALA